MANEEFPRSLEEALAQGFEPLADADAALLKGRRGRPLAEAAAVDCLISPAGTRCFEFTYSNGRRVVGFCRNGQCELFQGGEGPD
jgi:hypothetical protein